MHDHFRNRLTHSLEVAQIARNLAQNYGAHEGLCEAIALAHDFGHPPFSHAGEKALSELMARRGGFNHNTHSVRIVEYLEHPYPAFRGLNLTAATLNGLRAHATQYDEPISNHECLVTPESEIVSLADRIAYDLHDLEDAFGAGLIHEEQLSEVQLCRDALHRVVQTVGPKALPAIRRPLLDAILNQLLADLIQSEPGTQATGRTVLRFSSNCESALCELESFLLDRVYHHPEVDRADTEGQRIIHELFEVYTRDPELMPTRFVERIADLGLHRVLCDYIAGMTDNYCTSEHRKYRPNCF